MQVSFNILTPQLVHVPMYPFDDAFSDFTVSFP
jgi:hypothetical protein